MLLRCLSVSMLGAACLSLTGLARAHSITVDGDAADWTGTPPSQVYAVALSGGEFIYLGAAGDVRGDPVGTIETNADITEVRLTSDDISLFVLVRFADVTATDEVHVAIGIDLDNNPSDTVSGFLGDDSGLIISNAADKVEYNIAIHNTTAGNTSVELFHDNGSGFWFAPPSGNNSHISAANDLLEARIPLADIGMTSMSTFRFVLATFDNEVGFNNTIDTTVDYNFCDALDCIGGGTPGTPLGAFSRELGDGDMNSPSAFNAVSVATVPVELGSFEIM